MTRRVHRHRTFVFVAAALAAGAVQAEILATPPERSASLRPRPPQLASLRSGTPLGGPFAPTATPSLDGSPVEYLVVTDDTMRPAFERLAQWKTAKGVPAVVRTVNEVQATAVAGSDLAETIRNYIRDAYLYWGVRFVLLGGDIDVVPPRYASGEFLGFTDPVTDLYYGCLDGDWNADGDAFYGEAYFGAENPGDDADFIAEVFVGRAPVSTVAEANLFVDKSLAYEQPSVIDFQHKFLLLAEVLFPASYSPGTPISLDGAFFAEELRALVPPSVQTTRLYETFDLYPGTSRLTVASATNAINSGYGTVVHIGHGYRYTLSVGDGSLDVGSAAGFTNGARAGLFYMLNCTAAAFDFESFAESILLNPTGGATVVVGAAREAFPLASSDYQEAFFNHLYALGVHRVGETLARSREQFVASAYLNTVDRWTQLALVLLGDPELALWTASPRSLQLQNLPAGVAVGGQTLGLLVRDAAGPVAGALVAAVQAGSEYRTGRTDSSGFVALTLQVAGSGPVRFTVTAPDHLPLQTDVPVTTPARAVVVAGQDLVEQTGNLDGRWDAGETARLDLSLRNAGTLTVSGIQATLTSADAAVAVLQGSSSYADLGAGATAFPTTPFVVRALPGTPDGRVVTLQLAIQHAHGSETRRIELLVRAARLRLVGLRLDDARAGDGDGVQDAGEEIDLYYTMENRGSGAAQQVFLDLEALDAGLEVLAGTAVFADIPAGSSRESTSPLSVREADVAAAHPGRLVLRHLQHAGEARSIDLRPPPAPPAPHFVATDQLDAAHLEWTPVAAADLLGYDVWRAPAPGGPFARVNADVVRSAYFRDTGLLPSTRYYYRVSAVDSALVASTAGAVGDVSTNPRRAAGWPLPTNDRSASSLAVADVDGDGGPDLVAAARQLYAWNGEGIELVDADNNGFTWGLLHGDNEVFGSVTLADLDAAPGKEVVAATWDAVARHVVVLRADGSALAGWPRPLAAAPAAYRGSQVAPVVVNLDGTGAPEILLAARDGRLYAWHADGTEVADGDTNPSTQGVLYDTGSPFLRCAPAVADLDPARAGVEIVFGGTNGTLYVLDAAGRPLPGWPRTTYGAGTPFGGQFASGPCIADLDGDGTAEIVVLDGSSRLHALHLDGSELPGFPVAGIRGISQSIAPSPAIADLVGDAKLEIVAAGTDGKLYVIDAAGTQLLPGGFLDTGAPSECSPIVGDVDGDGALEIVFGNEEGILGAWNLDASPVPGFPIALRAEVRSTPTLADVNADGMADLAVADWDGLVHVWELAVPWSSGAFPWPTYRGNVHRTAEVGYSVPTPVLLQDFSVRWLGDLDGVRLAWRAALEPPATGALWRVYRAGPFAADPLGSAAPMPYNDSPIGERRGVGEFEFFDPDVEPGSWYVYILGWLEERPGGGAEVFSHAQSVEITAPAVLRFLPNVPNPFNPATRLRFDVPGSAGNALRNVTVAVYDVHGRRVRTLWRAPLAPGRHTVPWDGRDEAGIEQPSGVYWARLVSGAGTASHKLVLVR